MWDNKSEELPFLGNNKYNTLHICFYTYNYFSSYNFLLSNCSFYTTQLYYYNIFDYKLNYKIFIYLIVTIKLTNFYYYAYYFINF